MSVDPTKVLKGPYLGKLTHKLTHYAYQLTCTLIKIKRSLSECHARATMLKGPYYFLGKKFDHLET